MFTFLYVLFSSVGRNVATESFSNLSGLVTLSQLDLFLSHARTESLTRKSKEDEEEETNCLRFEVLTLVNMNNMIFWHVSRCILVEVYRRFGVIMLLDFFWSSYSAIMKIETVHAF
jgi:hypothetical protein